jgi:hypothetical protein
MSLLLVGIGLALTATFFLGSPFPEQGSPCSEEQACGAKPLCVRPTCYGGTDFAECIDGVWRVTFGCSK